MNETQIRERVRNAVGPANYPAGFSSRIEAGLKEAHPMRTQRVRSTSIRGLRLAGLGRIGSLAAALLVVVLMAAAVVGVRAWLTGGLFNIRPASPTQEGPSVMHYQDLLANDEQAVLDAQSSNCNTLTDACPAAAGRVAAALQTWLDDLNKIRPPAKFAYVDAQLRRHIALTIADLNAAVVAYNAHDQNGMDRAINAAVSERDAFMAEVTDIATSTQMTAADYLNTVRADRTSLLGCSWCTRLATEDTAVCQAAQLPSCAEDIAATRNSVDAFQGDLVRVLAPDALMAKDSQLQADVFAADSALNAMDAALSANDQNALRASHDALVRAFAKVTADATAIVG